MKTITIKKAKYKNIIKTIESIYNDIESFYVMLSARKGFSYKTLDGFHEIMECVDELLNHALEHKPLSTKSTCKYLAMRKKKLKWYRNKGIIKSKKINGKYYYSMPAIGDFLNNLN